jgi:hypothetical protein
MTKSSSSPHEWQSKTFCCQSCGNQIFWSPYVWQLKTFILDLDYLIDGGLISTIHLLMKFGVMIKQIKSFFGPRQGKNGWKYNENPNAEKVQHVFEDLNQGINGKPKGAEQSNQLRVCKGNCC